MNATVALWISVLYVLAAVLPLSGIAHAIWKSGRGLRAYDAQSKRFKDWIAKYETPLADAQRNGSPPEVIAELERKREAAGPRPQPPQDGFTFAARRQALEHGAHKLWGDFTLIGLGLAAGTAASIWGTWASLPPQ